MSIETTLNSKQIDNLLFNSGLAEFNSLINLKKSEKCRIIREHNYKKLYSGLYPESYKEIIYTDSPMLCLRMKSLEQSEQIELWKSDEYIAEEKIDGYRCYLVYNYEYNKNNGYELFSRENEETTLLPKNITNFLNKNINKPDRFYKSFLLDCEIVLKENNDFEIYCFDCLFFNDNNITEENLSFRKYITEKIVESISDCNVRTTLYTKTKKIDFFNYIKSINGEGVVIKNINSKYTKKGSRSKYNWIKVKGSIFDYSIIEDSLEGYISETVIDNKDICLSAFIDNNETSNKVAVIPFNYFNEIKSNNFFDIKLGIGTVIEFYSTFYSQKDLMFKNAYPLKIRLDKSIKDCYYLNSDLIRWSV